jgi:Flp pilus assembly protein TadB
MNPAVLIIGIAVALLALLVLLFFVIAPPPPRVARERRLAPGTEHVSMLTRTTNRTTQLIDSVGAKRQRRLFGDEVLDLAGIDSTPSQFVIVVASLSAIAALFGVLLGFASGTSILLAILFAIAAPMLAKAWLSARTSSRRAKFADQIDDTLQLIAGSLRAGHGLSGAIAAIAADADSPMSEELTRAVNESRLGRPLAEALAQTAQRMRSSDFEWVAQAIAINAEAGGNLADVLNQVGTTIRQRNEIRRQVRALSAEGRLSAIILIVLPIALFLFFAFTQPNYTQVFFNSIVGILALIVALLLMIIGSVWVALVVRVRF